VWVPVPTHRFDAHQKEEDVRLLSTRTALVAGAVVLAACVSISIVGGDTQAGAIRGIAERRDKSGDDATQALRNGRDTFRFDTFGLILDP
jgi:hypothetical protein